MAASDRLLDRGSELKEIRVAIDAAANGGGGGLAIEGEAGIGKTSLLDVAAVLAEERGMAVLRARATERERSMPYGVMRQLLGPAVARDETQALRGDAALAATVFGPAPRGVATADDFGLAHGLHWLVANLADSRPLALLVDDVQWADSESLRALAYLAQRAEHLAVVLALAIRVGEPAADEAAIDELRREARRGWLRPAPLSAAAVAELVARELGDRSVDGLASACATATAGNPFLIVEMLRAIAGDPDRGGPSGELVDRVAATAASPSILLRLLRLGEDAATVATAVAVLEPHASQPAVGALCDLTPEAIASASERLVAARLLSDQTPLTFAHPLVKAAVYDDLAAPRRAALHARAARMLSDRGFAADVIATHLLVAEPAAEPWAVEVLEEAAAAALGRGAPQSAARYLARALAEPPPAAERDRVIADLGRAQLRGSDPTGIDTLARLRERSPAFAADVDLTAELAGALALRGRADEAVRIAAAALAEVDRDGPAGQFLRGVILITTLNGLERIPPGVLPTPDEQVELAAPSATTLAQTAAFLCAAGNGPLPRAAVEARRLAASRDALLAGTAGGYPPYMLCATLALTDQRDAIEAIHAPAIEITRSRGALSGLATGFGSRAYCHLVDGDLSAAELDARTASRFSGGRFTGDAYWLAIIARVLVARGDLDAADAELESAWSAAEPPAGLPGAVLLSARGELHLARGRYHEALDDFTGAARRVTWLPHMNQELVTSRIGPARALAALGDRAEATRIADEAVDHARAAGGARGIGLALAVRGQVGGTAGIPLLAEAVEVLSATNAREQHARALVDLGAALRRANCRRDAREPLRQGLDLAHRCGATALEARARTELAASGARPRSAVLTGVDSLTPSELRIARLAADGLTNREIAQQLFVTTKTVETHLRHAYRKLDVDRRQRLPDALGNHG
jgi:DNA-binding CsgD family transcriptional regulator